MISSIARWARRWLIRQCHSTKQSVARKRNALSVERLEDRCTPASYTWNGAAGATWSIANNWIDDATGQAALVAPGMTDSVRFDGQANTDSVINVAEVKDVTIESEYTQTIRVGFPEDATTNFRVTGMFLMHGGTFRGGGVVNQLTIANNESSFNWTGGTFMVISVRLGDQLAGTKPTSTLAGGTKTLGTAGFIRNFGTLTWSAGNIASTGGDVVNEAGATFYIQNQSSITGGSTRSFLNYGLLRKQADLYTTTIDVRFFNHGVFQLNTGVVHFGQQAVQTGDNPSTTLSGGQLSTSSTYTVSAGVLEGQGTITGNVEINGSTFRPGFNASTVGMLTITGNFTQNAGGTTLILIGVTGDFSSFNVQGSATLNGTLRVKNVGVFTTGTLRIITYASVTGDFATITYDTPVWYVDGLPYYFTKWRNNTNYELEVVQGMPPPEEPPPPP